jgi:hypothetical protein
MKPIRHLILIVFLLCGLSARRSAKVYDQSDMVGTYGVSPYAFCNNNPVNLVDPDGRMPILVLPAIPFIVEGLKDSDSESGDEIKDPFEYYRLKFHLYDIE